MRFQKGQSGNPNGRPPGMRSAAAMVTEELLEGEAENLARAMIEKAKAGDTAALRLCLERVAPVRREREPSVEFDLPPLKTAADAAAAIEAITVAVAGGDLPPATAADLFKYVEAFRHSLQTIDFEERIVRLEQRHLANAASEADKTDADQTGVAP